MPRPTFASIDEYIASFPPEIQKILQKIRQIARKVAPEATETISYGIPTLKQNSSYVIYFAGFKNHVSVYPITSGSAASTKKIKPFIKGKGTVQLPLNQPIPYDLIHEIIEEGLRANMARTEQRKKK